MRFQPVFLMCRGYVAPEYVLQGQLTPKADVFSYGIVLLELVTGRRNMDPKLQKQQQYLLSWVCSSFTLFHLQVLTWLVLSQSSLQQFESLFWCSLGVGVAWRESSTGIDWSRSEAYMWWEAGYFAHESCSAVHTRCTKPAPHHVTHYGNADKRDTCNWGAYEAIYPCHTHFQRQMQQSHKHCQFIASRTDLMIIVDIF